MEGEQQPELDFDLGEGKKGEHQQSHLDLFKWFSHHLPLMQNLRSNVNLVSAEIATNKHARIADSGSHVHNKYLAL